MKTITFSSIPEYTYEIASKTGIRRKKWEASYEIGDEVRTLERNEYKPWIFTDSYNTWAIEQHGINLNFTYSFDNPQYLFSENGLASPGDVLGIAARINSYDSRQMLVIKDIEFKLDCKSAKSNCTFTLNIPAGKFRSKLTIEMLLYIKSSENGKKCGTVVATIDSLPFIFEGDASQYPIDFEKSDGNYLWRVVFSYDDYRTDNFLESYRLYINEKHPRFKELKIDSNNLLGSTLFKEILAEANMLFILKLKQDGGQEVVTNHNLMDESIGKAAYAMMQSFARRHDDLTQLSEDIHSYMYSLGEDNNE